MKKNMQIPSGQSLTEYALIGTLVGIASIGALMGLGDTMGKFIPALMDSISGPPVAKNNAITAQQPVTQTATPAGPSATIPPPTSQSSSGVAGTTTLSFTLNGKSITVPGYPGNVSHLVETLGANGATSVMANTIQNLAQKLLASGDINQTQYNALTALANQGHSIAGVEQLLENAEAAANTSNDLTSASIQYKGQSVTPEQLRFEIGFETGTNDPALVTDPLHDNRTMGLTTTFMNLYNAAQQNGVLNDPAVAQIVNDMVSKINSLSQIEGNILGQAAWQDLSLSDINKTTVSYTTNQASATICTTGNGTDTGIHCSG